jgi:hypothetical protein
VQQPGDGAVVAIGHLHLRPRPGQEIAVEREPVRDVRVEVRRQIGRVPAGGDGLEYRVAGDRGRAGRRQPGRRQRGRGSRHGVGEARRRQPAERRVIDGRHLNGYLRTVVDRRVALRGEQIPVGDLHDRHRQVAGRVDERGLPVAQRELVGWDAERVR